MPQQPRDEWVDDPDWQDDDSDQSFLSSAWQTLSTPLWEGPSRFAGEVAESIDQPSLERSPMMARLQGFGAGALQGIGDLVSGLTSPINLATTALTGGSATAARAGLPAIARTMGIGARGAGALTAGHGAGEILDPESTMGERGMGAVELAGGALGMRTPIGAKPRISPTTAIPETPITPESFGPDFWHKGIPETKPVPASAIPAELVQQRGLPPKFTPETAPLGQIIKLKQKFASPEAVKNLKAAGFDFVDVTEDGGMKFKKTRGFGVEQPILEQEVGTARPTRGGAEAQLGPITDVKKSSPVVEAFNLPRALKASLDFSAPLRQGITLIHKPEFWKSVKPMFKAWASEDYFRQSQNDIASRPLFRKRAGPGGKVLPSFADDAGLKLTDLTDLTRREEAIMSTWAEKVPGVRRSNRAYTAFLNNLRADVFESLVRDGKVFGADAQANLPLARALADFVNVASGRGSLGKLESSAVALNTMFFSPRLIAARLSMLDPRRYLFANPQVRKESLKSLLAVAAVGNTVGQLTKMAGGTVESDPNSSDFGKARIGNTRIDPYGGFQQYIVAANRLFRPEQAKIPGVKGIETGAVPFDVAAGFAGTGGQSLMSTTSGREYDLWNPQGPYDPTHLDVASRFGRGKLHPTIGFAIDMLGGMKDITGKPLDFKTMNPMENALANQFIPIFMQDLYELSQTDPQLLPIAGPLAGLGMGVQSYER